MRFLFVEKITELGDDSITYRAAGFLPDEKNETLEPDRLAERFSELIATTLARGNNLHHPHYVGHQVPASIPIAANSARLLSSFTAWVSPEMLV